MCANAIDHPEGAFGANVILGERVVVIARHPGVGAGYVLIHVLAESGARVAAWHLAIIGIGVDTVFETRREHAAAVINYNVAVVVERTIIGAATLGDWGVVGNLECVKPVKRVGAELAISGDLDTAIHRIQIREQRIKVTGEGSVLDDHPKTVNATADHLEVRHVGSGEALTVHYPKQTGDAYHCLKLRKVGNRVRARLRTVDVEVTADGAATLEQV